MNFPIFDIIKQKPAEVWGFPILLHFIMSRISKDFILRPVLVYSLVFKHVIDFTVTLDLQSHS